MNFFLSALLFTAFLISPCAAADYDYLQASRTDFYPSGARFIFSIDPDENGNIKAVIPGSFTAESVRLFKSSNAKIQAVRKRRTKWIPESLADINNQVDDQKTAVSDLLCKKASLEQTLNLINSKEIFKNLNAQDVFNYLTEAQKLRLKTEYELAELKKDIENEQDALKILQDELNARKPAYDEYVIEITGTADDTIELEAFTKYASWTPKYVLDMQTKTGDIVAHMYVDVSEKTGLDYNGEFSLHTKTPDENITDPSLNPVKVAIKKKQTEAQKARAVNLESPRMMKYAENLEDAMIADYDEDEGASLSNVVKETISDRVITIEGAFTGDGKTYTFEPVKTFLLRSTPEIVLIPEIRDNAWLIANMDENNERLIPGTAELRVDGHTTGNIYLPEFGQGQKKISFGYAEQITVKKESLIEKTGVEWFSGVSTNGYKLEITNGTSDKHTVTVRDRLPIPTNEKIKLEVKRIEPAQKEKDQENRYTWQLDIEPGKTASIIVDYKLSFPSGEELEYTR